METERFTLREFKSEDAKHLFEINEDWECVKYTGDSAFNSIEEATNLINNYDHYEKYGFGRWSVLHKETQEYLGWCGLKYDEALDEVDLGFRFYQKHWRKGFATEAAKKSIEIGFAQLRLKKIVGRVMPENRASIKVLEKVGMSFVERRIVNDQEWFVYAISS